MGRKQEIQNEAAERYLFASFFAPFVKGAQWEDETMMNKVCTWLKDNAEKYFVYDHIEDECYLDLDSMITELKKLAQ